MTSGFLRTERRQYVSDFISENLRGLYDDPVHMPSHYTKLKVECIEVTEHFNFCLGNAIKYIWRADHKGKPLEDLRKAIFYLEREIARRERESSDTM